MTQPLLDFDVCARKHGGAATSADANRRVDKHTDRRLVLDCLHIKPRTLDECAEILACPPNAISGRFTELAASGLIIKTGERRPTRSGATAFVWKINS